MIKLVQINAQMYARFDDLVSFLQSHQPDIINIQESSNGNIWSEKPIRREYSSELASMLGMNFVDHMSIGREYASDSISFGNTTLSRYPILDFRKTILNGSPPHTYPYDYPLFVETEKEEKYKYAFRLPLGCLMTLIDIDGTLLRNITAHFHVSYFCTETVNHIANAEHILEILQTSESLPTILTADMNIHKDSATIHMLSQRLSFHTGHLTNTLSRDYHPVFQKTPAHPGFAVDHVFSDGCRMHTCDVDTTEVSDHYPIVCEFELF